MGVFKVEFIVSPLSQPDKGTRIEGIVDTGAAYPFIPEDALRALGLSPTSERVFTLADGSLKSFPIGTAQISYGPYSAPCLVVFAPQGALHAGLSANKVFKAATVLAQGVGA